MRLPLIGFVVVLSLVACKGGREVGDPCGVEADACVDGRSLWECEDGEWARADCAQHCRDLGLETDGCLVTATGDACSCFAPAMKPQMCGPEEPDPPSCLGVHYISRCIDGMRTAEYCSENCAEDGRYSRGCLYDPILEEDACYCVGEGEPCERFGYPTCATETAMMICEDGRWRIQECAEACAPLIGNACYKSQYGAECHCYDGTGSTTVADSESSG